MSSPFFVRRPWLVAALMLFATHLCATELNVTEERYILLDAGQPRVFAPLRDQIAIRGQDGVVRHESIPSAPDTRALLRQARALRPRAGENAELILVEAGASAASPSRLRYLRPELVVQAASEADARAAASAAGLAYLRPAHATGYYILSAGSSAAVLEALPALAAQPGIRRALPALARQQSKRLIPNDTYFSNQWHLRNTGQSSGTSGVDVNVVNVWDNYRGAGLRIGIVDDGLQTSHPDLSANVDTTNDRDWNDSTPDDPNPDLTADFHGTACAGVAAARGNNSLGVSGAAPEATLVGLRLIGASTTDAQEADALAWKNDLIAIKSNSWGPNDDAQTLEGPGPLALAALETATTSGRGGLGTIFLWAGGNGGDVGDNSNYDGYANSIYTIAVGAVTNTGAQSYYSEPGANLVICAPSNGGADPGITTVDLVGNDGYNASGVSGNLSDRSYTNDFGGTSSATPLAAGVVALLLESKPTLGWRDVQEILMKSATQVSPGDADWTTNAAGFRFNHKFGAGMINASAAIALAQTWSNLPAASSQSLPLTSLARSIPDNSSAGTSLSFDLSANANLRAEHVTVTLNITHASRGQLAVTLTSPQGTVSRLAEKHSDTGDHYSDWTFMTVRNWGESTQGVWTLKVSDLTSGTTGVINSATLTVRGTPAADVNPPPVVALTAPVSGFSLLVGTPVALAATATDKAAGGADGAVASVEFFVNGASIGSDSIAPYTASWTPGGAGTYSLTAVATDNEGVSSVSATVLLNALAGDGSPSISGFTPTSGAEGANITISGQNFAEVSSVSFNGAAATTYTVNSLTSLTATVPAGATSGPISVTTARGTATSAGSFTVEIAPVLISQIYGGGGQTGSTFTHDYVELYNRGASAVSLSGWSVQYASSSGTSWQTVALSGSIAPGGYYLVQLSSGGSAGSALPAPNATGAINMSATNGKVALRNATTALTGSTPVGQTGVQDFVGYGTATAYEGSGAAPSPSTTTAIFRAGGGATDTGNNAADFTAATPNPRNASGTVSAPVITSATSASGTVGTSFSYQIVASNSPTAYSASPLPAGLSINTATGSISGTPTAAGTTNVTLGASNSAGSASATLAITIAASGGGGGAGTVFSENMGSPSGTTAIAAHSFQNSTLTFAGDADVRTTTASSGYTGASGGGNVFVTNTVGRYLEISGINTTGYSGLQLSFGHHKSTTAGGNELAVEVSADGVTYTALTYSRPTGTGTITWVLVSPTGTIPATANLRIRFRQTSTTTQFRIDDVKLTGTTSSSAPDITLSGSPAALTATYGSASATPTSFTVAATNLTAPVTLSAPSGFELSQSAGGASGYASTQTVGSTGTLATTTIHVRLAAGPAVGAYSGNISATSSGAQSRTLALASSQVQAKALTITAQNRTKAFGDTLVLGTSAFTASGLVGSETVGAVTLGANGGTGAHDAIGAYVITPSAASGGTFNAANYAISYQPGTLTVTGLDFANWIGANFSGASAAATADPDGDGLANLLEFYLGLDPAVPDLSAATPPFSLALVGGELRYTYRRSKAQAQYAGAVEWASGLENGTPWSTDQVIDELVSDQGAYEQRLARVPLPAGAARRFLRLNVQPIAGP